MEYQTISAVCDSKFEEEKTEEDYKPDCERINRIKKWHDPNFIDESIKGKDGQLNKTLHELRRYNETRLETDEARMVRVHVSLVDDQVKLDVHFGSLPHAFDTNVIVQIDTDINNKDEFYTDANSLRLMKRKIKPFNA